MAIVQVKDATGSVLDWMVGVAQSIPNLHVVKKHKCNCVYGMVLVEEGNFIDFPYKPSTSWDQGGPIIDRQGIQWCKLNGQIEAWSGFDYIGWRTDWDSEARMPEGSGFGTGPNILIAAMRCYVAFKLGDTVEVPDELI